MTTFSSTVKLTNNQDELIELNRKENCGGQAYELRLYPAKIPLDKCGSLYSKYIERKKIEDERLLSLECPAATAEPMNLNSEKSFSDYHAHFMHLYSRRDGSLSDWKEFHKIQGKYKEILRGISHKDKERASILASYRSEMEEFFERAKQREVKPSTDVVRSERDYTLTEKKFIEVHKKALDTQFEREEKLLNRIWDAISITDSTRIKELLHLYSIKPIDYEKLREELSTEAWYKFNACQDEDAALSFTEDYELRVFNMIESIDQQINEQVSAFIRENRSKKIEQSPIVSKLMSKCMRDIAKNGSDFATKSRYIDKLLSLDDNLLVLEKDFLTPSMEKILDLLPNLKSRICLSIINIYEQMKEAIVAKIKSQPDNLEETILSYKEILDNHIAKAIDQNNSDFGCPIDWQATYLDKCALDPSKKPIIIHQTFEQVHKEIASQDTIYQYVTNKKVLLSEIKKTLTSELKSHIWTLLPNLSPYLHFHILKLAFDNPNLRIFYNLIDDYDQFIDNYNHIDFTSEIFEDWMRYLDTRLPEIISLFKQETVTEIEHFTSLVHDFPEDQTEMLEFLNNRKAELNALPSLNSSDIEIAIQEYRDAYCQKSILENYVSETKCKLSNNYNEFTLSSLKKIFNLLKQDHFLSNSLLSLVITELYEPKDHILNGSLNQERYFYKFAAQYQQTFMATLEEKERYLEEKIAHYLNGIDPNGHNVQTGIETLIAKADHKLSISENAETSLVILEEFFNDLQTYLQVSAGLENSYELEEAIEDQKNILIDSDWQSLSYAYDVFRQILPDSSEQFVDFEHLKNQYFTRYKDLGAEYYPTYLYVNQFMETGTVELFLRDREIASAQKALLQEYQTEVENFLIDLELNHSEVAKKVAYKRNMIQERSFSDLLETDRTTFIQLRSRTLNSREDWIRFTDIQSRHRSILQEIRKDYLPYTFYEDKPLLLPSCHLDEHDIQTANREKEAVNSYVLEMGLFLKELEEAPIIRSHELNLLPAEILGEVPEVDLSFNTDERVYDLNVRDIANLDIARIFDSVSSRIKHYVTRFHNQDLEIVERRLEALKWSYTSELISEDQFVEQLQELDTHYSPKTLFEKNWTWLTDFNGTGNLFEVILQGALKILAWATIVFPLIVVAIMSPIHYGNSIPVAENLNPLFSHIRRENR